MKKAFTKQWIAGAVALSLIVGGGGFLISSKDASAADLPTTVAELKEALTHGKSIADLAAERGIDVTSVIDLQVSQIVEVLNTDLAANKITQEQYDAKKANVTTIVTAMVNGEHDGSEMKGKGGRHGGKGHRPKFEE